MIALLFFLLEHLVFGWCLRNRRGWGKALLRALIAAGILFLSGTGKGIETIIWSFIFVFVTRLAIDSWLTEEGDPRQRIFWVLLGGSEMAHLWVTIFVLAALTGEYRWGMLLLAFEVKHWLADWCLTNGTMAREKGRGIFNPWLVLHSSLHAIFSASLLGVFGAPMGVVVSLSIAEYLIHSVIDRSKGLIGQMAPITYDRATFLGRLVFGGDQMLHHATYVVMAIVALKLA
mgnify:CR=1 FL=1